MRLSRPKQRRSSSLRRLTQVITGHRVRVAAALEIIATLSEQLSEAFGKRFTFQDSIEEVTKNDQTANARRAMMRLGSLPMYISAAKDLVQAMRTMMNLQRQAFGMAEIEDPTPPDGQHGDAERGSRDNIPAGIGALPGTNDREMRCVPRRGPHLPDAPDHTARDAGITAALAYDQIADAWRGVLAMYGNGPKSEALSGRADRYYLLMVLPHRANTVHPWIYARCRGVEAASDSYPRRSQSNRAATFMRSAVASVSIASSEGFAAPVSIRDM